MRLWCGVVVWTFVWGVGCRAGCGRFVDVKAVGRWWEIAAVRRRRDVVVKGLCVCEDVCCTIERGSESLLALVLAVGRTSEYRGE